MSSTPIPPGQTPEEPPPPMPQNKLAVPLHLIHRLLRRIGLIKAPPPELVKDNETVWLFPNTAFPATNSKASSSEWEAEFTAAFFTTNSGRDAAGVVAEIANLIGLGAEDNDARATISERVQPFLDMVVEGRVVDVSFGGKDKVRVGPSDGSGVALSVLSLPSGSWKSGDVVGSTAVSRVEEMRTEFAADEGWGVISDIDDTIKTTHILDRISLLKHTFALPPTPVNGMPALYSLMSSTLNPSFFYLSASPISLYPMLSSFISSHFPAGSLNLRDMTWQELESFIISLTVGTQAYKEERVKQWMAWWPKKSWILIGDSTQTDPEAYAAAWKTRKENVKAIWIRRVTGVDEGKEKKLNSQERFEKAFEGVPREIWRVFGSAEELEEAVVAIGRTVD